MKRQKTQSKFHCGNFKSNQPTAPNQPGIFGLLKRKMTYNGFAEKISHRHEPTKQFIKSKWGKIPFGVPQKGTCPLLPMVALGLGFK